MEYNYSIENMNLPTSHVIKLFVPHLLLSVAEFANI